MCVPKGFSWPVVGLDVHDGPRWILLWIPHLYLKRRSLILLSDIWHVGGGGEGRGIIFRADDLGRVKIF